MENHCGGMISDVKQFHLRLTSSLNYQSNFECKVTLEINHGDHMFIKFLSLDVEQDWDCTYDWVELDDGRSRSAHYLAGIFFIYIHLRNMVFDLNMYSRTLKINT